MHFNIQLLPNTGLWAGGGVVCHARKFLLDLFLIIYLIANLSIWFWTTSACGCHANASVRGSHRKMWSLFEGSAICWLCCEWMNIHFIHHRFTSRKGNFGPIRVEGLWRGRGSAAATQNQQDSAALWCLLLEVVSRLNLRCTSCKSPPIRLHHRPHFYNPFSDMHLLIKHSGRHSSGETKQSEE